MEVIKDPPAGLCGLRVAWIAIVVVEIEGEEISQSVICVIFESEGGRSGNSFVRSGWMVL
jgi:hypothetical protein